MVMRRYCTPLLAAALCCGLTPAGHLVAAVVINEFMASNGSTLADEDGGFEDWIELYNSRTQRSRVERVGAFRQCGRSVQVAVS